MLMLVGKIHELFSNYSYFLLALSFSCFDCFSNNRNWESSNLSCFLLMFRKVDMRIIKLFILKFKGNRVISLQMSNFWSKSHLFSSFWSFRCPCIYPSYCRHHFQLEYYWHYQTLVSDLCSSWNFPSWWIVWVHLLSYSLFGCIPSCSWQLSLLCHGLESSFSNT